MEFIFLGTGTSQGVPVIGCKCAVCQSSNSKDNRLRASMLVKSKTTTILIDAGPDLRQQLLRANIDNIDAILITHEHQDHTAGLDEVRAINFLQNHSIPIYCIKPVADRLREQYSYIFKNSDYPGIPQIELLPLPRDEFKIGDISVLPIPLKHKDIPVQAFRFGAFSYITDANYIPEKEKTKLLNSKHLVINALRKEKHYSHFSLAEALQITNELKAENAWFTHISHQMGLHEEVEKDLLYNRKLAYDGLQISCL